MILDVVLAGVVLEAVVLLAWRRRRGGGVPAALLLPNLAAGFCLMLALRLALGGAAWRWIGLSLVGALLAHGLDLRTRWR